MSWFDEHFGAFMRILALAFVVVLAKQGIAIAQHGAGGWLRGEGELQTEWEVMAVLLLMAVVLPGALIAFALRTGEQPWRRFMEWRLERAISRGRRDS